MSLSTEARRYLLDVAREAVAHAARRQDPPALEMDRVPAALRRERASFVTLNKCGRLRGCIGSLEARRPLALDVQQNAVGAAIRDPRFPPVRPEEVDDLSVEISVLTLPEPLEYERATDLCQKLRSGVDGVVIERGWHRATFLPQVWDKLSDERQFLQRLCLKAGLAPDAYASGDLDVYTYQVEKIEEQ